MVCLTARPEVILARTRGAGPTRPLLQGEDPAGRIAALLTARADAYASADLTLDTSDRGLDACVDAIVAFLRRPGASEKPT